MLLGAGIAKHWNQLTTSLPNIYVASIHLSLLRWMAQQMNIPGQRYRDFVVTSFAFAIVALTHGKENPLLYNYFPGDS